MKPEIFPSSSHHLRNEAIPPAALTILKRLHEAGFVSFLVGGSVRDLLLHKKPKDFDIATSARPEEVKRLFGRQALLIGRRFRLVHVRFGSEFFEVSTFRAGDPLSETLILRDNTYGSPEEDALRRDFTINALFYDPLDHRIIDYVGGFDDLNNRLLRTIGDPEIRFKQDPVRMLRLLKFKARFDLNIEEESLKALQLLRHEIMKSSSARVLEEFLRMLESGASSPFFALTYESKFLELLMPKLASLFRSESTYSAIIDSLKAADAMNHRGHYKPLSRSILLGALLFPLLEKEIFERLEKNPSPPTIGQIAELCSEITSEICLDHFLPFPKRLRHEVAFIMQMQYRLTPLEKKRRVKERLARHPDFLLPLTFLKLRALQNGDLFRSYEYWKRLWKERPSTTTPLKEAIDDDSTAP